MTSWEVLTTRLPYHDEYGNIQHDVLTLKAMNALVSGKLRPDVSAVRADCPPALVALLQRCWDSEARNRPTMVAVVEELEKIERDALASTGAGSPGPAGDQLPGQAPASAE